MKIALCTTDICPGREQLMPFRTLIEVAKGMNTYGWEADVINTSITNENKSDYVYEGIKILQAPRKYIELVDWVNGEGYDVFFLPVTIREGLKNLCAFKHLDCLKIAYVSSGITPLKNAIYLMRKYGVYAKAWILEALTPNDIIAKKLKKVGFTDIIALSDTTAKMLGNALPSHVIYAGKDGFETIDSDAVYIKKYHLEYSKFYLFTGGPAPSRGGVILLQAFDKIVEKDPSVKLVYLMRNDVGSQANILMNAFDEMNNKDNVILLKEKLSVNQLKAFYETAYAVVLPFICIPSEIPLTYYEVMSCGTPVISFPNAGTTDYLKKGLKLCDRVSEESLCNALLELWNNESERKCLSKLGKEIMALHSTWEDVVKKWISVIESRQYND